jgi:hypothetical protein
MQALGTFEVSVSWCDESCLCSKTDKRRIGRVAQYILQQLPQMAPQWTAGNHPSVCGGECPAVCCGERPASVSAGGDAAASSAASPQYADAPLSLSVLADTCRLQQRAAPSLSGNIWQETHSYPTLEGEKTKRVHSSRYFMSARTRRHPFSTKCVKGSPSTPATS